MPAYSPTGYEITGTYEMVPGCAEVAGDSWKRLPDGSLDFEHAGGTKMFWDDMRGQTREGKDLFLDSDGGEWTADQIVLIEENEFSEADYDAAIAAGATKTRFYEDWFVEKLAERAAEQKAAADTPFREKCKRKRTDGPTPCLCCAGECVG